MIIFVSAGQGRYILSPDDPPALTDRMIKGNEMNRGLLVAVGGAAIIVAGLSGCSSDKSTSSSNGTTASSGKSEASVTLDGKDQGVKGNVSCVTTGSNVVIAIGDAGAGIGATLTAGDSPTVKTVGMGTTGGVALGYAAGAPGGEATATKDGSSYTITGKVTGVDMSNPLAPVTKPFEIKVTCP